MTVPSGGPPSLLTPLVALVVSQRWLSPSTLVAVSYGATSFSAALIHNIFLTYYVHLFMSVNGLDHASFYVGQCIYMVWNSVNDPLFGYLIEKSASSLKMRYAAISYGGPLWALAFLFVFSPLPSGGGGGMDSASGAGPGFDTMPSSPWVVCLHFILSLCLYDGMLSFVMLAHNALLADITIDTAHRTQCNMYSALASMVGSASVLLSHPFWSVSDETDGESTPLYGFRVYCCVLAVVASVGFWITGAVLPVAVRLYERANFDILLKSDEDSRGRSVVGGGSSVGGLEVAGSNPSLVERPPDDNVRIRKSSPSSSSPPSLSPPSSVTATTSSSPSTPSSPFDLRALYQFCRELMGHRNFWVFMLANLAQVFNCHFNSNFLSIFLDLIASGHLSSLSISVVICMAAILPHFFVVILSPMVKRDSLYKVIRRMFYAKLLWGMLAFVLAYGVLDSTLAGDVETSSTDDRIGIDGKLNSLLVGEGEGRGDTGFSRLSSVWVAVVVLFLFMNKVISEVVCRHTGLVLADLVDEDVVRCDRTTSRSSLLVGVNAFFTKPGQSLAPILGWMLLSSVGYKMMAGHDSDSSVGDDVVQGAATGVGDHHMASKLFLIAVLVPIGCALLQLLLWRQFSLRGIGLRQMKKRRLLIAARGGGADGVKGAIGGGGGRRRGDGRDDRGEAEGVREGVCCPVGSSLVGGGARGGAAGGGAGTGGLPLYL